MVTEFDIHEGAKRLQKTREYKISQRRRSKINRASRHNTHVSKDVYIYAVAYSQRRHICIQDAIDELARAGISQVFGKEPRKSISPGQIIKNAFRKNSKIPNKPPEENPG